MSAPNPHDPAFLRFRKNFQDVRNQQLKVGQTICPGAQNHNGDLQMPNSLLKGKIPVNRQEDIKPVGGKQK